MLWCLLFIQAFEFVCLSLSIGGESLQEEAGVILQLPDRKAQGFLVLISFKRLFSEYVHQLFGEMPVRR
jgi:hypothetical protein